MAEDQGVNGDRWTEEANKLLTKAGWHKIGDSNIDIGNIEGKEHGIDSLFCFEDGFNPRMKQGVFLEAKQYATTSLSKKHVNDWVLKLADKIGNLRQSQTLLTNYPEAQDVKMTNGVIAIWFHDLENYKTFKSTFQEYLEAVDLPIGRVKRPVHTRIFIMDNEIILRLVSLFNKVDEWNKENNADQESALKFYYPSSTLIGNPAQEIKVLNLEYIFSQFILAKSQKINANAVETSEVVFYFGEVDMHSFIRLSEALLESGMLHKQNKLIIYKYKRQLDEFRKIKPDVEKLFKDKFQIDIEIRNMDTSYDLPTWMTDSI